ncbi:MAG TPA: hypothetical protein VFS77_21070, partial [Pyrinomonadaceae bacterium]|nr:hypothetical protein [Pyrinomonadaceae bacterium]
MTRLFLIAGLLAALVSTAHGQNSTISVLDLGATPFAQNSGKMLRERLRSTVELLVADADLTRAAAKGSGYSGSLNLSVSEARDLGAALATDFYILGDAQTLRRSSSAKPAYYESYCSLFVVSGRTGRLLMWDRPSIESDQLTDAEKQLSTKLGGAETINRIVIAIRRAREDERVERNVIVTSEDLLIE